ncbi:hypothetical protein ACFVG9_41060, partial [Saccharothrix carnea]|uniref:hypothetical protein n=1 Tax=Saccharothrix carnea TaxID=1280637 RepID=UPI00362A89F2
MRDRLAEGNTRWNSGTLYGNRLNNSNEYYGGVNGQFTPGGYPAYAMGTLESAYFYCYGSDNCYFQWCRPADDLTGTVPDHVA